MLCDEKGVLKTFTFEKITDLSVETETFAPQKEKLAQIKENKNHWFSSAPVQAVLRLDSRATAYLAHKQFFIKQKITKQDDKFAYLSVTAAFEDEILNFAKLYLPYVKII